MRDPSLLSFNSEPLISRSVQEKQTPHCIGQHIDRALFSLVSVETANQRFEVHIEKTKDNKLEWIMDAGRAVGVALNSSVDMFINKLTGGEVYGTATVIHVDNFYSVLNAVPAEPVEPGMVYYAQCHHPFSPLLLYAENNVEHIGHIFSDAAKDLSEQDTTRNIIKFVTTKQSPHFILTEASDYIEIRLNGRRIAPHASDEIHQKAGLFVFGKIHSPYRKDVVSEFLRAAITYVYHLTRKAPGNPQVSVELFQVGRHGKREGHNLLDPATRCAVLTNIGETPAHYYGISLKNEGETPYYPYVVAFESNLEVCTCFDH